MTVVRVIEAVRLVEHDETGASFRIVVHFATDAGESLGFRDVRMPPGATLVELRAAVAAEWQALQAASIQGLIGQEWTF